MAEGQNGGAWGYVVALVTAVLTGLAALIPKVAAALKMRAESKRQAKADEGRLLAERRAFGELFGDLESWGRDHPALQLLYLIPAPLAVVRGAIYLWCNLAFTTLFGYEAGELDGQPWEPLVAPEGMDAARAIRGKVAAGGKTEGFRAVMVGKIGERITIRTWSTPGPKTRLIWVAPVRE